MPVMIRARRGTLVVMVLAGLGLACGDDGPVETGSTGSSGSLDAAPTTVETSTTANDATSSDDGQTTPPGSTGADASGSATVDDGPPATGSSTGEPGQGCEAGDYLVCEGFEQAAVGGFPDQWDLRPSGVFGGQSMGVVEGQAHTGTQALRIEGGSSGAQWLTYMGDISMLADGHWGRMFVRMGTPIPWPGGGVIHGDLFEARGNWNGSTHQVRWAAIENVQMMHNWGYNVQTSNAGEFIIETGYVYTWPDAWFCMEWHHDQGAQQATLWIDSEQVLDVTAADDPQLPTFDDISVGWANYQPADPQFVVYIDDVVLDDERVGCDP